MFIDNFNDVIVAQRELRCNNDDDGDDFRVRV